MSKEKTVYLKPEIDYEKLANVVSTAIISANKSEKEALRKETEKHNKERHRSMGLIEYPVNTKLFRRKLIDFLNFFIGLKNIIFYKKEYARDIRMTYEMLRFVSSLALSIAQFFIWISLLLSIIQSINNQINPLLLLFYVPVLLFERFLNIMRLEIEAMENREVLMSFFSALMAFIAALFSILSFFKG